MKEKKVYSKKKFLVLLKRAVKDLGGSAAAGRAWGVDRQNVHNAVEDNIRPVPNILKGLRLKVRSKDIVYTYEEV